MGGSPLTLADGVAEAAGAAARLPLDDRSDTSRKGARGLSLCEGPSASPSGIEVEASPAPPDGVGAKKERDIDVRACVCVC